ncbi:hypothetical protein ACJX0J_031664, partial [Zea mays]
MKKEFPEIATSQGTWIQTKLAVDHHFIRVYIIHHKKHYLNLFLFDLGDRLI